MPEQKAREATFSSSSSATFARSLTTFARSLTKAREARGEARGGGEARGAKVQAFLVLVLENTREAREGDAQVRIQTIAHWSKTNRA